MGAHLPRGPRQRGQRAHPLQVGRGPPGGGLPRRAAHRARLARGHGRHPAQPRALPAAVPQARRVQRGPAHSDTPPPGQVSPLYLLSL